MKIGKVVKESSIPSYTNNRSKFDPIRHQADILKKGEYLPVEFDTKEEVQSCANSLRVSGYDVKQRGNSLFIGRR